MLNRVVLIGRLTKKPELRYTQGNVPNARFTMAVNRNFANQQGERQADFINCVAWRKTAETMTNYLDKGSLIAIEGRIQTGSYENQQGQRVYTTDIIVENFQFLEPRGSRSQGQGMNQSMNQPMNNNPYGNPEPSYQQRPAQNQPTNVGTDVYADYGTSIDISDDDLPF